MPTDTTFLGLKTYNSTTDGSALFATYRADQAGTSATSNMNLIDTFASNVSGSIVALQARKAVVSIPAVYVSANYYEANSITDITSYSTNQVISLSLDTESDGTVTLNINSLGTKSLNKVDVNGSLVNLTGADLKKNREYLFRYNGTVWVWINGSSADQISISGTANNLVMISGCGVLIDSGLQTSGSKLLGDSLAITSGLIVTSGSAGVAISDGLEFTSGSVRPKIGDGLTFDTGSMIVKAGVGLDFSSGSLILSDSGVTSRSYNQVEVDDYGRVISGSVIITLSDGWSADNNTWTYASATTFTVAGDLTAVFHIGTRLRWKQGGSWLYGTVITSVYSSPNTTVTLIENDDYEIANAAITDNGFSYVTIPQGWPNWFNWTPIYGGFTVGGAPTDDVAMFNVIGDMFNFIVYQGVDGTSNNALFTISVPVTAVNLGTLSYGGPNRFAVNSGSLITVASRWFISVGATIITVYSDYASTGFATSGGKRCGIQGYFRFE